MATKKFIYGIAVVKFNSKEIGYIEKGSWDWGGTQLHRLEGPDRPRGAARPVGNPVRERPDDEDTQRHHHGQPGRQADADRSV